MGATTQRCPSCGQVVGRADYQCPRCELVLDERRPTRPRRENSVVRAMMERPRSGTQEARPRRPRRQPESASTTGPGPDPVPLDRLLHVSAELRLEKLNLHPYDAWVVSLIDGRSTGEALNAKLALEPRELQAVLQGLLDRGVLSLGQAAPASSRPRRASLTAPTPHQTAAHHPGDPEDDEPGPEPTQILTQAALGLPGAPAARDPDHSLIGSVEDDDEESTVSQAVRPSDRGIDRRELLTAARGKSGKLDLPGPEGIAPPERETQLQGDELDTDRDVASRLVPQETVLLGRKPKATPPVPQETVLLGRKPQPGSKSGARPAAEHQPATPERVRPAPPQDPPVRPMSAPGYRPPRPASASRGVPTPTVGIEDVDAQGALQVALQMEQTGRQEEAVAYLERALERSPDAAPLYNRLAVILMRDFQDFQRAEQLILQALRLSPGHPVFTRNLNTVRQNVRDAQRKQR